ncbi:MAG: carbohydrate-binding domain-containing protein [Fibrobacter sp.]|uniref:carbohydrate-binding domain-containing protein n=1 Tax=Fibrobacter sp. TaxID=35828 RepID=UPI0025BF750F|nr:carbohydrate-binding domain-containing protein [Fibrobacter sp.]MBQ7078816.1 carbohydrate-binding domain-containing protein [Fibrobacter sp.]
MNKKILSISCISSLSLAMLASCSDSTSDLYNPATPIAGVEGEGYSSADAGYIIASSDSETGSQTGTPTSSATTAYSSSFAPVVNSSSSTIPSIQSSSSIPATQSSSSAPVTQSSSSTQPEQVSGNTGERPVITYAASGATATNAGNCVSVTGGTVTIKCGGEYDISGSYSGSDAQILVNTAKTDSSVYLNMRGLTLSNTADAPIYIQKASKAFVVAKNGTTNTLSDGSSRTKTYNYTNDNGEAKTDTTGACIYAKDDLTIKGEGTLIVNGNYNNGIHTSNDLKVKNGLITVKARNNGLKGKNSVEISGGTINITTTEGDGIKSDTEDAADLASGKGSIEITGGEITITSAFDGITAANAVVIANGESTIPTIKVTAGGGHNCLSDPTSNTGSTGGRGGMGGFGPGGGSSCSPSESMKGIKGDSSITISAGVIDINSRDDGLHSSGSITVSGGSITVATDDDGVHAEKALYVKDNANISVALAYEGMESPDMHFEGGITSVITTDDGWNAAGGTSTTSTGGNTGRGGLGGFGGGGFGPGSGSTGKLTVTGGYHYIYVGTGDTDGVDSNGDITISGGVIIVECRMNGGMGGMVDSDGTTNISSNAKLLGFGTNNSEEGSQYSVSFNTNSYYGTSSIAFKPSFSGNKMVSSVGQPSAISSVSGMTKTCFGNSTDRCVYTK